MIKVGITVMPREVILDTQGRAVEQTLKLQHIRVQAVRVGRYIELELPLSDREQAMREAKHIAESTLYNPLIEKYEIEVLSL